MRQLSEPSPLVCLAARSALGSLAPWCLTVLVSNVIGCGATSSSSEPEDGSGSSLASRDVVDGGLTIAPLDATTQHPSASDDASVLGTHLDAGDDQHEAPTSGASASGSEVNAPRLEAGAPSPSGPSVTEPGLRCGDGTVTSEEHCDDGNLASGDGCSERCRVERGKKCEGEPSVCVDTECGDGVVEGAEVCDDGNTSPFDGCSPWCLNEPNCEGASCTSVCGDGLVFDEDCDDGNTISGDGCSAECHVEAGFICSFACEQVNGQCVLRVPALFRDFAGTQPDFGYERGNTACGIPEDAPIVPGIAGAELDADGRPVLGRPTGNACIEGAESFARWFREGLPKAGEFTLYDNGMGGYVNRFGANGEQLVVSERTLQEQQVYNATSPETCEPGCSARVRSELQCDNLCRPRHDAARSANDVLRQRETQLRQVKADLAREEDAQADSTLQGDAAARNEARIADLKADIETLTIAVEADEANIETLEADADACDAECQTDFDGQVAACAADCKPCSFNPGQYCTGGTLLYYDGTPLFFPVDDILGETRTESEAWLAPAFGFTGWPTEEDFFGTAVVHNFSFTTEVRHWFRYEADTNVRLAFTADDDMWVFINGKLAVDLGGIHVPMDGEVNITAETAETFGLEPGKVYPIVVFQAERKMPGSAIRITFPPFDVTPSECVRETR